MIKINVLLSISTCFILLFSCKNPFFPETGIPKDTSRDSPEGAIKQLKKAYERRRIDLFEDLLYSKEEFRFYIEQNEKIIDSLQKINPQQREQVIIEKDLDEDFIADDFWYVYLTYNEEMNIHRNLFREADQIVFESFNWYNIQYFIIQKEGTDTIEYDTVEAVVYTDETEINISSKKFTGIFNEETHAFPIGKQVFFLKKDNKGLWKIHLWFERRRKTY